MLFRLARTFLCALLPITVWSQESPLIRAQALLKQGQAREALPILLKLHGSESANVNLCQQIGIAYTQLEDFSEAEKFFREALRLNPDFWAARKNLGTVLWFLDRREESEREFLTITKVVPEDPVPHLYLALAAHARRDFTRATAQFRAAGALAFGNPEVVAAVLESFLGARDTRLTNQNMEQLAHTASEKNSSEVWRMLGEAYDRQQKPSEAYHAFSKAIESDLNSDANYIALAEFAAAHGNNDFALQVVARGLNQLPLSPDLKFEQGLLQAVVGDRGKAEASFMQAGRLKPDWILPNLALGVSRLEAGETAEAAHLFENACAVDPADFRAQYLYATALAKNGENRQKAISAANKAIALNPSDARAHVLLGQLDAGVAEREWRAALKIDPENATALYQLGLLYRKQGKAQTAEKLLATFQKVKAKKRTEEDSLVQILRITPQKPSAPAL